MQTIHKLNNKRIKITLAIIAVIIGTVSFFTLTRLSIIMRFSMLTSFFLIAFCVVCTLIPWHYFFSFIKESIREIKKVIWPTRTKTIQITMIVFIFVLIMAIFLWGIDKLLEFLLYSVILGWK